MTSRRSTRTSAERGTPAGAVAVRPAGFSLVELLVVIGVTALVMGSVVRFFGQQARAVRRHGFRIETQQALRGALDAIARDVRLAGACLPTNGEYVALEGTEDAGGDSITVRTGLVRGNLSCVYGTTTAEVLGGAAIFPVDAADDFVIGKLAYVRHPNGSGQLGRVLGTTPTSVRVAPGATQVYPVGSTVYAVDQRRYSIDTATDPPLLFLTVDEDPPQAFAAGVSDLDFRYVLNRNCPACDVVDLSTPLSTATWWLVNEVIMTAEVRTVGGTLPSDEATLTQEVRAKPRNLLP